MTVNFTLTAARLPFQVQMLKLASKEWYKFIFVDLQFKHTATHIVMSIINRLN